MTGSLRAYAKHRKVSVEAVSKAIEADRIADAVVGTKGRSTLIDFEKADELWKKRTEPRARLGKPAIEPPPAAAQAEKSKKPATDPPDPPESYDEARRRSAVADADIAERKRDELLGLYWLREDVIRRGRAHAAMHASAREGLPSQLAPQLAGKTDLKEIERVLREALRDCDKRVADEITKRFGDADDVLAGTL